MIQTISRVKVKFFDDGSATVNNNIVNKFYETVNTCHGVTYCDVQDDVLIVEVVHTEKYDRYYTELVEIIVRSVIMGQGGTF